jgi:flavin reductase (DIM6/NTAB) family NADH-FMN oxidoreductase RutF
VTAFDDLVSELDYPMFIVTAAAGAERAGCLVGFTTQASIDPGRFLVCLSDKNRTFRLAHDAQVLTVHALGNAQMSLAELFGGRTGDDTDKLSQCSWSHGPGGSVIVDDAPAWFVGTVLEQVPFGDHVGFLLEPVAAQGGTRGLALLEFGEAKSIEPGHEP